MPDETNDCPICACPLPAPLILRARERVNLFCFNCGSHSVTEEACSDLYANPPSPLQRAALAHQVWKVKSGTLLDTDLLARLVNAELPPGPERIDNLVMLMAEALQPGERLHAHSHELCARLGCESPDAVRWVMAEAHRAQLITDPMPNMQVLTMEGWLKHQQLLREGSKSRHAFMAMRFGDVLLDQMLSAHMVPAVAQTGFELRTVAGDHQTAGSIDNRMRVEIRTSRFLVCDLTHGNRGAYWEAGFAEGLGRPVFYVCRRDVLEDRQHPDHPHFDTAHQLIVTWHPDTIAADMAQLKAAIRATLPAEARMEDT